MILGKNARGKYSIMKPRYQYFLTDRTEENQPSGKRAEILKTVDGKLKEEVESETIITVTIKSALTFF